MLTWCSNDNVNSFSQSALLWKIRSPSVDTNSWQESSAYVKLLRSLACQLASGRQDKDHWMAAVVSCVGRLCHWTALQVCRLHVSWKIYCYQYYLWMGEEYHWSFSTTGRQKDKVLPLPVRALPMRSLPSYMGSKVFSWMGKSPLNPLSVKTLMVSGVILKFVKGAPAVCCEQQKERKTHISDHKA